MSYKLFESTGFAGIDLSILLIIMFLAILISWVIAIVALAKYSNLNKKYKKFMGGNDAKALESHLMNLIALNDENCEQIAEINGQIKELYNKQKYNFQKIGMIKYDAFKEMGGNLSFALTLLDENNNGFIINSIHSREGCYTYIKEIVKGESYILLGEEEKQALALAIDEEDLMEDLKEFKEIERKRRSKNAE